MSRLTVGCTLLLTSIYFFLDIKYPSSSSPKTSFVDFFLFIFHLTDQRSLILKLVLGCDCKLSLVHIKIGHTDLLPPQACEKLWQGCQLCDFTLHHQLIVWVQVNHPKVYCLLILRVFNSGRINTERRLLIYQHHHQAKQIIFRYIVINFSHHIQEFN